MINSFYSKQTDEAEIKLDRTSQRTRVAVNRARHRLANGPLRAQSTAHTLALQRLSAKYSATL